MSFHQLHWFSPTLLKQVGTWVIYPDKGEPPFPVFYLLHGLSDDHTIWLRRTRIEEYLDGLPMIVVMPDGFRGFYTNNNEGPKYATYMTEDLPRMIERTYHAKTTRAGRCIGGLSMGGYGALRLALGYPDLYISANSHSGALLHGERPREAKDIEGRQIFGARPAGTDHDLTVLARRATAAKKLPAIRIDCGTGDFLFKDNQEYHQRLTQMAVPHEYVEVPGGVHEWPYWDVQIRDAIKFHGRHLGIGDEPNKKKGAKK